MLLHCELRSLFSTYPDLIVNKSILGMGLSLRFLGMGLSRVWWLPPLFCGRDSASHFKSRSRPGSSGELNSATENDKNSYSRFQGGSPSGLSWFSLEGGGWLVGDLDQDGSYTGEAAYLYPDPYLIFVTKATRILV